MSSRGGAFALVALCWLQLALHGAAAPPVPAVFVFGDSIVDVGNNNYIDKCDDICRADYPHFGVDYPDHAATGRFSNGYNLADQLAQLLGFAESPPPFLSLPNASLIPQMSSGGINFASGGSGLLDETGNRKVSCGQVLSMLEQVRNFTNLAELWKSQNQTAVGLVNKSLFFISAGSNDLFERVDYGSPHPSRNDTAFLQLLVSNYESYLRDLYGAGARKFSVLSTSLVGCCPSQRAIAQGKDVDKYGCYDAANNLSRQLHPMIASMLNGLSLELPGMNYSLVDSIKMAEFTFNNPQTPTYNFTVLDKPCCGSGQFGANGCNFSASLCPNRDNYLFWDDYHPSNAATKVAANLIFTDTGLFVHPINVQQLVEPRPQITIV